MRVKLRFVIFQGDVADERDDFNLLIDHARVECATVV
jgi:hypothetical protein